MDLKSTLYDKCILNTFWYSFIFFFYYSIDSYENTMYEVMPNWTLKHDLIRNFAVTRSNPDVRKKDAAVAF